MSAGGSTIGGSAALRSAGSVETLTGNDAIARGAAAANPAR